MVKSKDNDQPLGVRASLYWNSLIRIPSLILSFVISLIVARILMPKDFGILAIVMMIVGYANTFTNVGFTQAIVQKNIYNKQTLDSIFTLDLAISCLLAFSFYLLAGHIAAFFDTPECENVLRVMSMAFIITSFYTLPHGILRRDMQFKAFSVIESIQKLMVSFLTLILALLGFGYWALAYGQLIPLAIIALCLCLKAQWYPSIYYSNRLMMDIYGFGAWSLLRTQINSISRHVDKFIIGKWLGADSLGFYDKSISLAERSIQPISMNINSVMFSSFSKNKNAMEELQSHFKQSLSLTAIIIFPICTGLICIAPYFVYVLLGEKWSPMILPFQTILFGFIFKSCTGITANFNIAVGKYKSHSLRSMVAVIVFVFACFGFLQFGIYGIASSFVIYCISLFLLAISLAKSFLGLSWMSILASLLPGILPSIIMSISVLLISNHLLIEFTVLNLVLLSLIGALIYSLCFYLNPFKDSLDIRDKIMGDLKKNVATIFN